VLTPGRDARPRPLIRTAADEWGAVFSPDGRFIAYTSDESGRNEVYLKPYPGPGERRQLSTAGGYGPVWNRSRSEVFFRSGDTMMTASVSTRPALSAGAPSPLFDLKFKGPSAGSPSYDAMPDGRRFVLIGGGGRLTSPGKIHVVLGWLEDMKRRVVAAQD
jgi:serine/threonine-protein kinase